MAPVAVIVYYGECELFTKDNSIVDNRETDASDPLKTTGWSRNVGR